MLVNASELSCPLQARAVREKDRAMQIRLLYLYPLVHEKAPPGRG
jgi:hypothetical protein